jgi:hypothetical protein
MDDFRDDLTDQANPPQLDSRRDILRWLLGLLAGLTGVLAGTGHGDQGATAAPHPKSTRARRRAERARKRARRRKERSQGRGTLGRKEVKLTLYNDMGKPISIYAWRYDGRFPPWLPLSPTFPQPETLAAGDSRAWTSQDNAEWSTIVFLEIDAHWMVAASNPRLGTPEAGFGFGGRMRNMGWQEGGDWTKLESLREGQEVSGVADGRFISIRRNEDSDVKEFVARIKPA